MFDQLKSLLRRSSNSLSGVSKRQSSSHAGGNHGNDEIRGASVENKVTGSETSGYAGLERYKLLEKLGE